MSSDNTQPRRFVVEVWVDEAEWPVGPHQHDPATLICHTLGNGHVPQFHGVSVEPLSVYLECQEP